MFKTPAEIREQIRLEAEAKKAADIQSLRAAAVDTISARLKSMIESGENRVELQLGMANDPSLTAHLSNDEVGAVIGELVAALLQSGWTAEISGLGFIAFDVMVGETWLSVPDMEQVATGLGLEVVPYSKIPTDLDSLDRARDAKSIVAERRGCGTDKAREGVVLRPLIELTKNNGERVIAKHRLEKFNERATPQKVVDADKLAVLSAADAIAQEWVVPMRLAHVIDKVNPSGMADVPKVIAAMIEDVYREAKGEIVESKEASAAISKRTAMLYRDRLKSELRTKLAPEGSQHESEAPNN